MFVFYYLVMTISFTYLLVHSEGETTCDCSEVGVLKEMVQQVLYANRMNTYKLRRLEEKRNTGAAPNSKTIPVSKGRIETLEQKVEDLEVKFNTTITTAKENQEGFGRNIGAIVKKTLRSEKKERTKFISSVNANIRDHSDTIETFKTAMNNTIDERLRYITAIQNEHSQKINETFNIVRNNISTFQEDVIDDVNKRNDRIKFIVTDLNNVNQSVNDARDMIEALDELVKEDKGRIETLEQKVEDLEVKFNNTITTAKGKQEGFGRNIGTIVKKTLLSEKKERTKFISSVNGNIRDHSETIETFKTAMNNTIDERLRYITAIQNEHSHKINETFNIVRNNISTFQEVVIDDVNKRIDRIKFIVTDLNNVNQSVNDARDMIEALDKLVKEEKDWLPWSEWGNCSVPCNAGLKERTRTCSSKFGCLGNSKDFSICNNQNCKVRLVNGSNRYEGRLEVFHDGVWGTVCDDRFNEDAARVVCRMLNFPSDEVSVHMGPYFGQGSSDIWLDNVECSGTESNIFSCSHSPFGKYNCGHDNAVGISCHSVRLVDGRSRYEGRLEVFHNGVWGTVCDDEFTDTSAAVVCKELNYPSGTAKQYPGAHFGRGILPILLDDVECQGTESTLSDCPHRTWGKHDCGHDKDVGISCIPIRLVDGSLPYEGRLEVFHNGVWGTVCDDGFTDTSAAVACKALNYPSDEVSVHMGPYFGQGSSDIGLDNVECSGTESNIFSCSHSPFGKHNCGHDNAVGISCHSVRLVNGSNRYEGRLEVFHDGVWGTVCDDRFNEDAARVVCRMLHFLSDEVSVHMGPYFGQGSSDIGLDNVECSGTESNIFSCSHSPFGKYNCGHDNAVGISCHSVRLVNGSNRYEGRLEVFHDGVWGTVCDDRFNEDAARVVCRMLHFLSGEVSVHMGPYFGQGSSDIRLANVECSGTESNIFSCSHSPFGKHDCGHHNAVGISCHSVRLVDGRSRYEGRLEVFHNGVWGTVCDDEFTDTSAAVVCKELNYPSGTAKQYPGAHFGRGILPILLDDVECQGTESTLSDCPHRTWGKHDCGHDKDVGISCIPIRLVDGSHPYEGRLEVFHNGVWGTVCDDGFTDTSAAVVCKALNYPSDEVSVHMGPYFGQGSSDIWLDNVECSGTESNIFSCSHSPFGKHNCGHDNAVGISCHSVRLVDGRSRYEGRLEVFHNGVWGTVCDDEFTDTSAAVVCKELNYPSGTAKQYPGAHFGRGILPILLDDVECQGTESTLSDCPRRTWGKHDCGHDKDVGISCIPIRLVNGSHPYEGRLEVFHNGVWGTVCDDGFTDTSAAVVCKALNYPSDEVSVHMGPYFGQGSSDIWLDNVECSGTESNIFSCSHSPFGKHNCGHDNAVGISCHSVRLVDGRSRYEGRLEVFHNEVWGTVCDDYFTDTSAAVVCKELNYPSRTAKHHPSAHFGQGVLTMLLDDVKCQGTESTLSDCPHLPWGKHDCSHSEDVGISCITIRLVNGSNHYEGRLEVFHNGIWGTVCGDDFTDTSAAVVCKELNYPSETAKQYQEAHFGPGVLPILLDNVKCQGTESTLSDCQHRPWGTHSCDHSQDVGISCIPPIRLVDGRSRYEGRLEVFHNGVWGTVCNDFFTYTSATVVCKELNYPSETAKQYQEAHFGQGVLPILLDDVKCQGTESTLSDCQHRPWGKHDCSHYEDVGISCITTLHVRLVDGNDSRRGRVEVSGDGSNWGTVCNNHFTNNSAKVVCRMLGYPTSNARADTSVSPGRGSIFLDDVTCVGTENTLIECEHSTWGVENCNHSQDIGVICD